MATTDVALHEANRPVEPKRVVTEIVESLDRDSILREAREEILARLRRSDSR